MAQKANSTTSRRVFLLLLRNRVGATISMTPGRNASSSTASRASGTASPRPNAIRPASHKAVNTMSGSPEKPRLPVQLGTAVSRKPATAAAMKPKIISWACQNCGGMRVSGKAPAP